MKKTAPMPPLELLMHLSWRDELHHATQKNSDGSPQRWRVNGKPADVQYERQYKPGIPAVIELAEKLAMGGEQEIRNTLITLVNQAGDNLIVASFRLPLKHGLRNTDQLHLPQDAVLVDWTGWERILRKRKAKAEKLAREVNRNWEQFKRMMLSKSCYWLAFWHPDGRVVTRIFADEPNATQWHEQDRMGRVLKGWIDYSDMHDDVTKRGFKRF